MVAALADSGEVKTFTRVVERYMGAIKPPFFI